ncbi:MAG TPA: hypothetical protein VEV38_03405 [Candidatus Eremiobacteraceae bacterium]|nr:hypothetical protein [Candidatus Eremiobacteraceae bacterium]
MRRLAFAFLLIAVAGCTAHQSATPPVGSQVVTPYVIQNGKSQGHWKMFTPHTTSTIYRGITTGPDGNVWFSDNNGDALVRTMMTGKTKSFVLHFTENGNTFSFAPLYPITGADGKFYITTDGSDPKNGGGLIGVLTTKGAFKIYDPPSGDNLGNNGLAVGPDGNVWFAEKAHFAKITTAGVITEFAYPSGEFQNSGAGVVNGPGGKVWFTEYFQHKVANIDPTTDVITEFDVSAAGCSGPQGLTVGTDGLLYFNCSSGSIAKMTTSGAVTVINNPYGTPLVPQDMITGPNGHIWFTTDTNVIAEYNENNGTLTGHTSPFNVNGLMLDLTEPSDGNVWTAMNSGILQVYIVNTLSVSPAKLTFTGTGQQQTLTATYHGPSTLSAVSSDTSIATVAPGGPPNTFVVTSVGVGKAKVTVEDQIGNLFTVAVTVE